MQFRDLFGDGDVSGDFDREACFGLSYNGPEECAACQSRYPVGSCRRAEEREGPRTIAIGPDDLGLPRDAVRQALVDGADIVLAFTANVVPPDRILLEVAHLLRRLRNAGTTIVLQGLAHSVRARIARLETSLGHP